MYNESTLHVSLDIGTYKTAVVVAEQSLEGVKIIGLGTALSHGLRKGLILNIETTAKTLKLGPVARFITSVAASSADMLTA